MIRRTNGNNGTSFSAFIVNNKNQVTGAPNLNITYDNNGNPIFYGNLTMTWDDENRLTGIVDNDTNSCSHMTQFKYDGLGRLRVRDEYDGAPDPTTGNCMWTFTGEATYICDGWRVIEERSGGTPTIAYTRGNDLSGTLEGAGGIGGLLARSDLNGGSHAYYHCDGVGNITCLLDTNQTQVASYRYNEPFGNSITASGSLANDNVYRFSSKEYMASWAWSGFYYYGYRFFDPNNDRWLNRDPLGQQGGINLYAPVGNAPTESVDYLGLKLWYCTRKTTSGPPAFGMGRHGFIWDPRPGKSAQERECGQEGSSGISGSMGTSSGGEGPLDGNPGAYGGYDGDNGGWANSTFECMPIADSEGQEDGIMNFCQHHIDDRPWLPPFWDCHNAADWVLKKKGRRLPPFRRWNHEPPLVWSPVPPPVPGPKLPRYQQSR